MEVGNQKHATQQGEEHISFGKEGCTNSNRTHPVRVRPNINVEKFPRKLIENIAMKYKIEFFRHFHAFKQVPSEKTPMNSGASYYLSDNGGETPEVQSQR